MNPYLRNAILAGVAGVGAAVVIMAAMGVAPLTIVGMVMLGIVIATGIIFTATDTGESFLPSRFRGDEDRR